MSLDLTKLAGQLDDAILHAGYAHACIPLIRQHPDDPAVVASVVGDVDLAIGHLTEARKQLGGAA